MLFSERPLSFSSRNSPPKVRGGGGGRAGGRAEVGVLQDVVGNG